MITEILYGALALGALGTMAIALATFMYVCRPTLGRIGRWLCRYSLWLTTPAMLVAICGLTGSFITADSVAHQNTWTWLTTLTFGLFGTSLMARPEPISGRDPYFLERSDEEY